MLSDTSGGIIFIYLYVSFLSTSPFLRVLEYEVLVRDYYIFVLVTDLVSVELIDS